MALLVKPAHTAVDINLMRWPTLTPRQTGSRQNHARDTERRRNRRFNAPSLTCPVGRVIDLSVTGMRVVCDQKPAIERTAVHQFTLANDHQQLPLNGRVVRVRRTGLRGFELGVAFVGVEPPVARSLEAMAKFGFFARESPRNSRNPRKRGTLSDTAEAATSVSATVPNLYALLEVERDATPEEIQEAYRAMARRYHPDVTRDEKTIARFQLVHDAYKTLRDPSARRVYDAMTADLATPVLTSSREG